MKIPDWVYIFIRKLPSNFSGNFTVHCVNGGVTGIDRNDHFDERIFRQRFKEYEAQLKTETEAEHG
jgi:hypothetical protein